MATYVGTPNADTITPTQFPALDGADDSLIGGDGDDVLDGGSGNDTLEGGNDADMLRGSAGNDSLNGGAGDDTLNGGSGADTMTGGAGNDTYVVDGLGDIINEANNAGNDSLVAGGSYVLGSGVSVENLRLAADADVTAYGVVKPGNGSYLVGNEVGGQRLTGNEFNNTLDGGRNALGANGDTLDGGAGDDTFAVRNPGDQVLGGAGNDIVYVDADSLLAGGQIVASWSADTVANGGTASTGIETISASDQSSKVSLNLGGNADAQVIAGNMGNNVLTGGGGNDTLIGLDGNDTYRISTADTGAIITEAANGGIDTLNLSGATGNFSLATNNNTSSIETIKVTDAAYTGVITGNSLGQTIDASAVTAGTSPVTLIGCGGADTLIGGQGVDTFVVDSADDVVQDRLTTTATAPATTSTETNVVSFAGKSGGFDLADDVNVNLIQTSNSDGTANTAGTSNVYLVGNNFNQAINGNAGNNILDGQGATKDNGTGAAFASTAATKGDTLTGGDGDDIYRTYSALDSVIEGNGANSGNDIAYTSSTTQTAYTNVETLSAFDQGSAANAYNFTGGTTAARLIGAQGNDTLTGQVGRDTLIGLGGDDTYNITTNAPAAAGVAPVNTVIQEAAGGGNDILNLTGGQSYTLSKGVEIERINLDTTFAGDTITGNETSQVINGANAGGSVTLNGGGGTDTLIGGAFADQFVVDDASDVIIDTNAGTANSISFAGTGGYDLAAGVNVDNLSVATSVTTGVYLVGNEFSQTITGGIGNDVLNGDGGLSGQVDRLAGQAGDDVYRVWNAGDTVVEAAGNGFDTVYTSVNYSLAQNDINIGGGTQSIEQLSAADQSSTGSLTLIGNDAANRIIGNQGSNILAGGNGQDVLIGLGGADTFSFANVGSANADTIQDFSRAQGDKIQIVNTDSGTTAAPGDGIFDLGTSLSASEFVLGTSAVGTNAQIIYDQATGRLFYDNDGTGAGEAQLFAQLTPGTELALSDFTIVTTAPTV